MLLTRAGNVLFYHVIFLPPIAGIPTQSTFSSSSSYNSPASYLSAKWNNANIKKKYPGLLPRFKKIYFRSNIRLFIYLYIQGLTATKVPVYIPDCSVLHDFFIQLD